MAEPRTLKVEFEADLRRFRLRLTDEKGPANQIRAIHKAISTGFSLSEDEPALVLKYKDDEGDLCTLVEATLEDFLSQPGDKPLRLVASRALPPVSSLPTASSSTATALAHKNEASSSQSNTMTVADPQVPAVSSTAWPRSTADGCHSMGPWKLLQCLRTLQDAGMMTSKMVGSMMLQFLPILSQRAHRKQEKLNKLGHQKREALLALLHSVSAHLDLVEEAKPIKPILEDFITGKDVYRLGDFVAALFKALSASKDRRAVSEAITGVGPELCASLPQLFPALFGPTAVTMGQGVPEHTGIRCSACSREPIKGPRFHCAEAKIDLCGECFIDQGCVDQQFECRFMPSGGQAFETCSGKEDAKAWPDAQDWKAWKGEWMPAKGKGKGKNKGKGKWHRWFWPEASEEPSEEPEPSLWEPSETGDGLPPGLEPPFPAGGYPWWQHLRGKGKGKGKFKGKGGDMPPMPFGPWEGPFVDTMPPPLHPHFWPWGWDGCGAFDNMAGTM